jgi:outer membrane protein OmpA-like peptidoglycan-associated protein
MKKNTSFLLAALFVCQASFAQQTGSLEETTETQEETVFTRGTRIIFNDDFSKDAVGDFPARWTTNKSGEVKKLKVIEPKFLKIADGSVVSIQLSKPLPINFTAEFDLILPSDIPVRMASFGFGAKPNTIDWLLTPKDGIVFSVHSNIKSFSEGIKFGTQKFSSADYKLKVFDYKAPVNQIIKMALMVNDKRIRLYIDGKKTVDMPNGFDASFRKSIYFNATTHGSADSKLNYFYISNIILAEAGTDRRSQVLKDLMENGSFSTNAIQFATNSDKLTATSNEIIRQIADALIEDETLRLEIVGHTDGDGDADKNLTLSKKRANSVKIKLVSLGIADARLSTNGKGEAVPVADNKTAEGKAQNRRVEFVNM